jgi:hypothetical protein
MRHDGVGSAATKKSKANGNLYNPAPTGADAESDTAAASSADAR